MFEVLYRLFIACCVFGISLSGFMFAAAMWRRSVNQCKCICEECKCCN